MLNVNISRVRGDAHLPTKAHPEDGAWDLYASLNEPHIIRPYVGPSTIPTGVAFEIPVGYIGLVLGRSGFATKGTHTHVGLIDPGYIGEINAILDADHLAPVQNGDRIAQLVILKNSDIQLVEVPYSEMKPSERGTNGLGSTGK
jgi:dUTP pyrophosphatase